MPRKTKAQIAAEAAAAHEQRIAQALRWTPQAPPPDVAPPQDTFGPLATGWLYNAHSDQIAPACTDSVSHAYGRTDHTTTQNPRWLYSTRLGALLALRNAVERQCAERLARIDAQIEAEEASR